MRQSYLCNELALGKTLKTVAENLGCSVKTLQRDKKEIGELPVTEELMRKQMEEIESCDNEGLRLRYRGEMIRVLRPLRREDKVEASGKIVIEFVK